ncbi:hypothetical protein EB822_02100 [Flavobacteriaceae bacterium PRS1]|nr:hypothetical protein EB822_02100 [Flavobacteriaceae bacterium PRS1]
MYVNKAGIDSTATANSGVAFSNNPYWSSTEYDTHYGWQQFFSFGQQYDIIKYNAKVVRAVRAF